MTIAAVVSIASALVSLLTGLVAIAFSRSTALRSLRWFAFASLMATVFSGGNVVVGLPVSDIVIVRAARVTLSAAALHGLAWVLFDADMWERTLTRAERFSVGGAATFSALAWVPGLLVSDAVVERIAYGGIVYRDALPTPLGMVAYAYYCLAIGGLVVRNGARVWRGERGARAPFVGLSALALAAVLDSLAASQVTHLPYVVDFAAMVAVLAIGTGVGRRFVETALALEESAKRLATAQADLVARERLAAVGEMSAVVAHEVRNPLAIMFNALGSLRREIGTTDQGHRRELLDILQEEADRLRRLVDDFLDFARPVSLRFATTDVAALIAEAIDTALTAAPSEHDVAVTLEGDLGAMSCDVQLVRHALVNLIVNARQLEAPPTRIEVRARSVAGELVVAVIDHGPGLNQGAEARLFTPFFTTRARGTGLGLTIVKRIAEAHGGTIAHTATPGGGATFTLTLPQRSHTKDEGELDAAAE